MFFYIIRMQETNYYKYGITEDLKTRLSQYKTGNPIDMEIVYLQENPTYDSAKKLESYLSHNDSINSRRIKGRNEWLELNELEIKKLINELEVYPEKLKLLEFEEDEKRNKEFLNKLREFGNPYFAF